ncbi:MAG: TlpA family protein disulfide reductase [Caldilineales bacterium]|nr:TlpA family protein disulfide reductase [Caldilineales bacterium]MDW8318718.1 TlpA disulfide reductase family protein [Anaerolineae bacterium]
MADALSPTAAPKQVGKRRALSRYLILVLAAGFVALLAYGLMISGDRRVTEGQAPDFTLTSFEGKTYRLSELQGQVVVLNFWATWCVSCKDEADDIERVWRQYRDRGVLVLGVNYLDQEPLNRQWIQNYDITYPNGPDIQGRIYNAYGVQGLPETFIVDPQGQVAKVFIGPVTEAQLVAELERLLRH